MPPLYDVACLDGHAREIYVHTSEDKGAATLLCACGETLAPVGSFGGGITAFRENNGQWIENLADVPVYVTSHSQHQRLMREHGVTWATLGRGRKGCWQ